MNSVKEEITVSTECTVENLLYDAVSNQPWYSNTGVRSLWEPIASREGHVKQKLKEAVK